MAVALLGLLATQGCTPSAQALGVGNPAPDFTLVDLDGNQVSLSDFRGKTVFINFWATRCPPCRREMPQIEAVYQEYKDRDVIVIGVHVIGKFFEPEDKIRQFVQEGGYNWTFVTDTTGLVAVNYGVFAIPTSFFIDSEGIIRAVKIGEMNKGAMEIRLRMAMEPKVE
jgi:peroxiredoxin